MSSIRPYGHSSQADFLSYLNLAPVQPKIRVQANLPSVSGIDISDHLQVRQTSDQGRVALFEKIIFNIGVLYANANYPQSNFISCLNLAAAQQTSRVNASVLLPSTRRGGISDDSQLRQASDQGLPLIPKSLLHPGLLPSSVSPIHSLRDAALTTNDQGGTRPATFCKPQLCAKQPQKEGYNQHKANLSTHSKDRASQDNQKVNTYLKRYRASHKDKIAEINKRYRKKHKDMIAERNKQYQLENKDKVAEINKRYREKHKDKIAERNKQYYLKKKTKIAERNKQYYLKKKQRSAEQHE